MVEAELNERKLSLIKGGSVKDLIKSLGSRSNPDFLIEVERQVDIIVRRSFERAKENGRNTVMRKDV